MATKNYLQLDLSGFTEKVNTMPATQLKKLDEILFDLANHAYDTYEYVLDLKERIKDLPKLEAESMMNDLTALQKQVNPLMNTLCDMDYDSKYMDRVQHTLGTIEDEIPALLTKLKKQI